MKYTLIAAFVALIAGSVRAEQQAVDAAQEAESISKTNASYILDGQDWRDRECCESKPEWNQCRCKKGEILLGTIDSVTSIQTWKCYSVDPNCKITCRAWDGFCGFCLSAKTESRPNCEVPEELFDALPAPATGVKVFLTFDKNGYAAIEQTSPQGGSCKKLCCNDSQAVCLRRLELV